MTLPRELVEGISVHVIQRGNNRCRIFGDDEDRERFLQLLAATSKRHDLEIHAYVLMDTHFHLLATPRTKESFSSTMRDVGSEYVRLFNRKNNRIGTLWNQRPRAIPILDECRWLMCLRYVEQNPVRARMVNSPDAYRWSSYSSNALGVTCNWLTPHAVYTALGPTHEARQLAYRAICAECLSQADLVAIRHPVKSAAPTQVVAV